MSILIDDKEFGKFQVPKEGFDKQALLEKYLDAIRQRKGDYMSGEGENEVFMLEKSNRVVVETAVMVGWVDALDVNECPPRKLALIANAVAEYIKSSTQVSKN